MSPRTARGRGLGTLTEQDLTGLTVDDLAGTQRGFTSASGCSIFVGHEPALKAPQGIWLPENLLLLWHLSIAHSDRYPSWDEIAEARYELVPDDVTMALLLPPPENYVNVHPNCFHLWQIDDRRVDGA